MKRFSVGAAGRKNMSKGMDEYWIEVNDGKKERPDKYDITTHDRQADSANGKKAKGKKGFTWSAKKRTK